MWNTNYIDIQYRQIDCWGRKVRMNYSWEEIKRKLLEKYVTINYFLFIGNNHANIVISSAAVYLRPYRYPKSHPVYSWIHFIW